MRAALAVTAVLLLAGCGGNVDERVTAASGPIQATEPPPPIVAIDEPAPEMVEWFLHEWGPASDDDPNSVRESCDIILGDSQDDEDADEDGCAPPTPEEREQIARITEQWRTAVEPAPDSPARSVARLELTTGGRAVFVAWRNRAGELCITTQIEDSDGSSGGGGPRGPCVPWERDCEAICVWAEGGGPGEETQRYVLTGLVPSTGELLRVTLAGGAVRTFPLTGPMIRDSERRVVMIELGPRNWRRVELVRDGDVAATAEMPPLQVASEECWDQVGPEPVADDEVDAWLARVDSCVSASMRSDPGWPSGWAGMPAVPVPASP
jgi:hypothetical protein